MVDEVGTVAADDSDDTDHASGELAKSASQGATVTPLRKDQAPRQSEASRMFAEASLHHRQGRLVEAVAGYDRAIALWPTYPDAYNNLGVALRGLGRLEAAVACYRRSLNIRPDDAGIHSNLGNALRELGRYNRAAAAHQQAVTLAPQSPVAIFNLGLVLRDLGHVDEAIGCFDRALAIRTDYVDCRWERALSLLQKGDFRRGFQEYAWRSTLRTRMRRQFEQPAWEGEDLKGRTILIHFDQGYADMVQFARYVPFVCDRGGNVVVECPADLVSLLATLKDVGAVVAAGTDLPHFDVQVPLSALPAIFDTTLETIPARVPYLRVPEGATAGNALTETAGLRVGIAWAGDPSRHDNILGTCPLHHFVEFADLAGVNIYSLQSGAAARESRVIACDTLVRNVISAEQSFGGLAAAIAEMDLIISIDSTVAHVAGAMGRPVWLILPFVSEWRWLDEREDSPWYPTMALFRQEQHDDWDGVFKRLRQALGEASRSTAAKRAAG